MKNARVVVPALFIIEYPIPVSREDPVKPETDRVTTVRSFILNVTEVPELSTMIDHRGIGEPFVIAVAVSPVSLAVSRILRRRGPGKNLIAVGSQA